MKKTLYILSLLLALLLPDLSYGQTERAIYNIVTNRDKRYCASDRMSNSLVISFRWRGTPLNINNKFEAELSSPTGDFAGAVKIGELVSRGSNALLLQIPIEFPRGTSGRAYRIKIKSTSPAGIEAISDPFEAHHIGSRQPLELNNLQNIEICPGSAGRTIAVTDGPTASVYKWYKDDAVIEGATGNSYTVTQPGKYSVEPDFGACGSAMRSNEITASLPGGANSLNVKIKGNATKPICTGQTLTLESEIENGAGLTFTYQWYKDNTAIAGANQATYGATSVGSYTVKATPNQGCEKTSVAATLTQRDTNGLLVIAGEATQVKCTGQTLSLTASLTDASLTGTYKWYKNGTEIPGANTLTYTVTDVASYYITLTEPAGCVIKSNVVNVSNRSSVNPGDIKWLTYNNEDVVFSFPYRRPVIELDIPSTETLTVKWFKEDDPGTILQENTTRSHQVTSEGTFIAEVYDACGTKVSSGVLKLHIKEPSRYKPIIGFKQGNSPCAAGQAVLELVSLEASITHNGTEKKTLVPSSDYGQYTLQWKKDGVNQTTGKEIAATVSNTLATYRLMVNGAFNSNEIKLVDIKLPTAVRLTTDSGLSELQPDRALSLIPTLVGTFQQEFFTYKWYHRKDDTEDWVEKADVTAQTDKKYTIPALAYGSNEFRQAVGQYKFAVRIKEATVNIAGDDIDLTPYAQSCGQAEGHMTLTYTLTYTGKEIPNLVLLNGEELNRKWILPAEWAGAKVTIYKQTGEVIYQAQQYQNDFPSFEAQASKRGAAIYFFYILEKDGKTQRGVLTVLH